MGARAVAGSIAGAAAPLLLALLAAPFAYYAGAFGAARLTGALIEPTRFESAAHSAATIGIFAHMAAGAAIMAIAPFQLVGPLRRRAPRLHRVAGYATLAAALVAAAGGFVFILSRGTIGGRAMDVAFGLYGACLAAAAIMAALRARARDFERHREWALRLFVLALGSWLYRVHYGLWALATGGVGSSPDFSGPFDQIQLYAFFVPYLLALELWFRRERWARSQKSRRAP